MTRPVAVFLAGAAAAAMVCLLLPPVAQDPGYHRFADPRALGPVPNFLDVLSNVAFLIAGLYGWRVLKRASWLGQDDRRTWAVVALGAMATALGSAAYHWAPDDESLYLDRLPMTLVFMGVFTAMLSERLSARAGRWLPWLLLAGIASVEYWRLTDDLRPYLYVQFFPMAALPCLLLFRPARYAVNSGWWELLGLYALAKAFELLDAALFGWTGGMASGHPLKHVAAGLALAAAFRMIERRGKGAAPAPTSSTAGRAAPGVGTGT